MSDELKAERSRQMKDYEEKVINIMDSAKDNIRTQFDKAYKSGYEDAKSELGKNAIDLAHEESDRAYQQGLEDAWEAARKITKMNLFVMGEIFGTVVSSQIAENNTAQEVISKIKEYEEKQKQDTEIQVGDEVYSDAFDDKGIVTHITADKVACVCIICNGFTMMKVGTNGLHKTGRHFDAIAEVLAEMRGE